MRDLRMISRTMVCFVALSLVCGVGLAQEKPKPVKIKASAIKWI